MQQNSEKHSGKKIVTEKVTKFWEVVWALTDNSSIYLGTKNKEAHRRHINFCNSRPALES
eukprot:1054207-Amphidinium_carterae.2